MSSDDWSRRRTVVQVMVPRRSRCHPLEMQGRIAVLGCEMAKSSGMLSTMPSRVSAQGRVPLPRLIHHSPSTQTSSSITAHSHLIHHRPLSAYLPTAIPDANRSAHLSPRSTLNNHDHVCSTQQPQAP